MNKQPPNLDFENLADAVYLLNPTVLAVIHNNHELIAKYFPNDTKSDIGKFYDFVLSHDTNSSPIKDADFKFFLDSLGVLEESQKQYMDRLESAQELTQPSIESIIDALENESYTRILYELNQKDIMPSEYMMKAQKFKFNKDTSDTESPIEYEDMHTIKSENAETSFGKPLPSSVSTINKSYPTKRGHIRNTLICIAAAPGVGKSQLAMDEMIEQLRHGESCCYLAIGDLLRIDFKSRMVAKWFNFSIDYSFMVCDEYWGKMIEEIETVYKGKFKIVFVKPNEVFVEELIQSLIDNEVVKEYDNFFFDYDNNIASIAESMFDKGNEIYQKLCALSRIKGKTVFVMSQIKSNTWQNDVLEEGDLGESRRKAEISDAVITISSRKSIGGNRIGRINVAKNRRGKPGFNTPYFLDISGRFYEISERTYTMLANQQSLYTNVEKGASADGVEYRRLKFVNNAKTNSSTLEIEEEVNQVEKTAEELLDMQRMAEEEFRKEFESETNLIHGTSESDIPTPPSVNNNIDW